MYNYHIRDWHSEELIISSELEYIDMKEMYEVFILTCYKKGVAVAADMFVEFLLEQGIEARLMHIEDNILCCSELEDNLAEKIQNL